MAVKRVLEMYNGSLDHFDPCEWPKVTDANRSHHHPWRCWTCGVWFWRTGLWTGNHRGDVEGVAPCDGPASLVGAGYPLQLAAYLLGGWPALAATVWVAHRHACDHG